MVYFFICAFNPDVIIYMGKDKYENEELIKWAWPDRDIWFHVDDLSSAHVYLRLKDPINDYSEIPPELIAECSQLTKANSIQGCKLAKCGINYTWARNLKKTIGMEVGAVTFHKSKLVKTIQIEKDKDIVKRIMKTKTEEFPNLEMQYREHLASVQKAESDIVKADFMAAK
jgi:predicted ribosome quality control (RQC) complex YloA/Tae2 family protein